MKDFKLNDKVIVSHSAGLSQVIFKGIVTGFGEDLIGTCLIRVWDYHALDMKGKPYPRAYRTYMLTKT